MNPNTNLNVSPPRESIHDGITEISRHLQGFVLALVKLLKAVGNNTYSYAVGNITLSQKQKDMLAGAILTLVGQKLVRSLIHRTQSLSRESVLLMLEPVFVMFRRIERDEPSRVLSIDEILNALKPEPTTFEQITNNAIRATSIEHLNCQVRFYSSFQGSSDYVGMGFRNGDSLIFPYHVSRHLRDSPFTIKSASRHLVQHTWCKDNVITESVEFDVVVYKMPPSVFATLHTKTATIAQPDITSRCFIMACHNGSEQGTKSIGYFERSPLNAQYLATYSSVPGHSGATIMQLQNSALKVVGMHIGAEENGNKNIFTSSFCFQNVNLESAGSTGSNDTEFSDTMARVRAAKASNARRAQLKAQGEHRFDDDILMREWEQIDGKVAADEFKRNEEDFYEEFAYVKSKGWLRRPKRNLIVNESAKRLCLKVSERVDEPLKEISPIQKISAEMQTSQDSSLQNLTLLADTSAKLVLLNPSPGLELKPKTPLSDALRTLLKDGNSKNEIRRVLVDLNLDETSSIPSTTLPIPQEEVSKN